MKDAKKSARVSDEAVQAKTGKTWKEWFALLDRAGAKKMSHTAMAAYLYDELGCPGWWNQMVAVSYEQERGLRDKHERPDGYSISRSKTLATPVERLYEAWEDAKQRSRWLKEKIVIRKGTPSKSMRITWSDGATNLEVNFYAKGDGKSQVTVQHSKLADTKAAERMKAYWGEALERLCEELEE
jgi:Activator of Hsp90 ATPase homolog 1-like protein